MIRAKASLDHKRIRRLIWLVLTVFVLLGYSLQSVTGTAYYSLVMQNYGTVSTPPVILHNGTTGTSTIYANSTSAKVNVEAPLFDYVDNNYPDVDSSADKGMHSNFPAQQAGPDSIYETLTEENTEAIEDHVDNNISDVDNSPDVGTHGNFENQKAQDSSYDTLTEASQANTYSLDATGGYMIIGDGTPDWGSSTGTISFWVKMDNSVQGRFYGQNGDMETRWSGTNLVLDWGATTSMTSAYSFSADTWYFVAIVWDENNDNLFLYVGDENNAPTLDANSLSGTWTSTTPAPTENRFLNGLGGSEPVDGHGDDLRYWNIARNLTEIQSDYKQTLSGSEPNLQSYFKLDDNFADSGPNNDDGTGSPTYSFSSDVPFSGSSDYGLDLEVQWTNVIDFLPTEKLCIYTGALSSEDLRVDYWNGTGWENLATDLIAYSCNYYAVSLTSTTFTVRFKDGTTEGDTTQDQWQIDASLLRVEGAGNKEDAVDQQSNVDGSADVGIHGNFSALQYGPDSINDILTEENTVGGSGIGTEVTIDTTVYDAIDEYNPGPNVVFINDTHGYTFFQKTQGGRAEIVYRKTTNGGTSWGSSVTIDCGPPQYTFRSFSCWYDKWTYGNTGTKIHLVANNYDNDIIRYNCLDTADDSSNGTWTQMGPSAGSHNAPDGGGWVTVSTDGNIFGGAFFTGGGDVFRYVTSWSEITPTWLHNDDNDHAMGLPLSGGDILYIYEDSTANTLYYDVYDEATDTWGGTANSITTITSGLLDGDDANWGAVSDGNNNTYLVLNNDILAAGGDLECWFFSDTSRSWTQKTNIATDIGANGDEVKPAVDTNNGDLYAVYIIGSTIYCKNSTDGGNSWGSQQTVSTASQTWRIIRLNFMSDERIYAIYFDVPNNAVYGNTVADLEAGANYELDLEIQWTSASYTLPNEELCIYAGTTGAEDIKVDVWNGSSWINVISDMNSSAWNNVTITSYLTSSNFTIRFKGGNETGDTNQDIWNIDVALIHVWYDGGESYELDLEVQWTNADYTQTNEELCIKTGTFSGSENIQVKVWNNTGSSWHWVMNLTASQWNNVSITPYLTSNTFTVQFLGGTETGDTTQDSWNIDATLLHVWTNVQAPTSWLSGWDKRVKITIDNNDVDSPLSNFPVLVHLSNSSGHNNDDATFVFDEVGSNSKKIAVTTSDGTQCYVEIERWDDVSEQAWLWVKVPSISNTTDTDLCLYYDMDHADNTIYVGDTDSTAAQNVWDPSFKGVWHLGETSGGVGAIKDSTSNNNVGTDNGSPTFNATGRIDSAVSFDGIDDYINMSNSASLQFTSSLTIEAWINLESFGSGSDVDIVLRKGEGNPNDYQLAIHDQKLGLMIEENDDAGLESSANLTATTWYYLAGTWNGSIRRVYLNGSENGSGSKTGNIPPDTRDIYIGGRLGTDLSTGVIDEVRASNTTRSAAWIKASYESERDDLLVFGSEETCGRAEEYDFVLQVANQVANNWTINLQVYDSSNLARLSKATISFHDGNSSDQIIVSDGSITQPEGPPYNLTGNATIYISMSNLQATTNDLSYLYVHLKIQVPDTSTYMLYLITFEIT